MKLTQTRTGKIIATRLTRNGSHERIGELSTKLNLADAKSAYHGQLEQIEREFNGRQDARESMRLAVAGLNQWIVTNER